MNRRSLMEGSAIGLTGLAVAHHLWPRRNLPRRSSRSVVAILRCADYGSCHRVVDDGLRLLAPRVRGKCVLLKPNLVEYSAKAPINTHPRVVAATADSLYRLGAAEVNVADGPGHVRDSELLLEESGMKEQLAAIGRTRFVDLNFDAVRRVIPLGAFTTLTELWLPETVLKADIVISMPKIKTHHWAGVTLSLKNLFGCVPGNVYGWPKNFLHWQGIDKSIAELAAAIPIHYVIADGIEAMDGNGPLHGNARSLGCLVFADDPIAADATCCRLMGLQPSRVRHLDLVSVTGNLADRDIVQCGESVSVVRKPFGVLPEFRHLLE
jgi:uncharacterized protein (DUF362 family)